MKIKEVEARVGLPAANIRYYEKEGLLHPERDTGNNYREYTQEHVKRLEEIKKLRLLGISIREIKKLYCGELFLTDVIQQRLEQLEKEQKSLELTKSICKNALKQRIEMDSLDALELDGGKTEWKERLAAILNEDCSKEMLTKKQLNFQVMLMLAWGYLLSTAVTILLRGRILTVNAAARTRFFEDSPNRLFQWRFIVCLIILIALAIAVHWTANMKWNIIFFHLSILIQVPAVLLLFYRSESLSEGISRTLPAVWMILVGYVVVLWMLSVVWDKFFVKIRYSLLAWGIFTAFVFMFYFFTQTEIMPMAVSILLTALIGFFLTMEWTVTNLDSQIYNRYDAVLVSAKIINILALIVSGRGYFGAGNIFRR